jgi:hypothetical protein
MAPLATRTKQNRKNRMRGHLTDEQNAARKRNHAEYISRRVLSPKQLAVLEAARKKMIATKAGHSPSARAKATQSRAKTFASGHYKPVPAETRSRIGKLARSKVDPQKLKLANQINGQKRIGGKNPPGPSEAGPHHWNAKFWRFRCSTGQIIEGMNLNHLVRQNASLFDPSDIVWKKHRCLASSGLRHLFSKDGSSCSWKGWTAITVGEIYDPIERQPQNLTSVLTSAETESSRNVVPEAGIEPATKGL